MRNISATARSAMLWQRFVCFPLNSFRSLLWPANRNTLDENGWFCPNLLVLYIIVCCSVAFRPVAWFCVRNISTCALAPGRRTCKTPSKQYPQVFTCKRLTLLISTICYFSLEQRSMCACSSAFFSISHKWHDDIMKNSSFIVLCVRACIFLPPPSLLMTLVAVLYTQHATISSETWKIYGEKSPRISHSFGKCVTAAIVLLQFKHTVYSALR